MNLKKLMDSHKSWQQDYELENGQYMNNCIYCKSIFIGHKRRIICKECYTEKEIEQNQEHEFMSLPSEF